MLIVNTKENQLLWIEAKGDTSSREGSNRFGLIFDDPQCKDYYSRAFLKACEMRDEAKESEMPVRIAMAFAHTRYYQKYFDRTNHTRQNWELKFFGSSRVESSRNSKTS